jgi:hypothetical protein
VSRLVFKVMKAAAAFHAVDYNARKQRQGKAALAYMGGFGPLQEMGERADGKEVKRYLQRYSERNTRIRNPQFHAILSAKGRSIGEGEMVQTALRVMSGLGYAENPIAVYLHSDTRNLHLHIVSSRVGPDGRKVSDRFEGIRAQRIINAELGIDPAGEFRSNLSAALSYRFSSLRQFELLMELRGYRSRRVGDILEFFRHGTRQGKVELSLLEKTIAERPVEAASRARVRGLILGNMEGQERELTDRSRTRGRQDLGSELTDSLHRRFGLQFVFFSSGGHGRPYGYVVIDHAHRAVHKGGDVLRLAQLTGESEIRREAGDRSSVGQREGGGGPSERMDGMALSGMLDELVRQVETDAGRDVKESERIARWKKPRRI